MSSFGTRAALTRRRYRRRPLTLVLAGVLSLTSIAACTSHTSGTGTHSGGLPSSSASSTPSAAPTTPSAPDSLTPSTSPSSSSPPVLPQTNLVITRSGWDASTHTASAVAILPGQVLEQGSCTFTLTLNGVTQKATKASTPDASSTDCGLLTITDATLTPGSWSGVVTFTGGTTTATSTTFTIAVTS